MKWKEMNMHSYNTISDFENWNPHIQSLADRLLIGPQRELLEKVQRLNNRYNLGINVTRTYRWSQVIWIKLKIIWLIDTYKLV